MPAITKAREPRVRVLLRVPVSLSEQIRELAYREHQSVNTMMCRLLAAQLHAGVDLSEEDSKIAQLCAELTTRLLDRAAMR